MSKLVCKSNSYFDMHFDTNFDMECLKKVNVYQLKILNLLLLDYNGQNI